MGLNTENDETCQLAAGLARPTAETMTGVIAARCGNASTGSAAGARRLREMRAIAARCARLLGPGRPPSRHRALRRAGPAS